MTPTQKKKLASLLVKAVAEDKKASALHEKANEIRRKADIQNGKAVKLRAEVIRILETEPDGACGKFFSLADDPGVVFEISHCQSDYDIRVVRREVEKLRG